MASVLAFLSKTSKRAEEGVCAAARTAKYARDQVRIARSEEGAGDFIGHLR
jgi:hypothetical protein